MAFDRLEMSDDECARLAWRRAPLNKLVEEVTVALS